MKKKINFINIFIVLFLVISIFYPLSMMISKVSFSDFTTLITSIPFRRALFNSLSVTLISTLISILIAYILAYTINRCNIKYKNILKILITIPMLIPSISHGIGLINLFGASGIISRLFDFNIVGEVGIIVGSIMYSFPVAFIMIDDSFKYIDSSMYDNAKVLGLSKFETFKSVTLCYLKKPLLSSIFAIFTLIFTDYGVPLAVGGKFITLPVYLYKEVLGLLDYSKGTMIGMFLIVPAIISFIIDNVIKDRNDNSSTSNYIVTKNNVRDIVCKVFTFIIILFVGMILGSFIYYAFINNPVLDNSLSLNHFSYVIDSGIFKYIINSIMIALFVSLFGTIISYLGAYSTSRMKIKYKKIVHLLMISSLAIPGIVLGLSYSIAFNNSFIYNTFIILILVNIVHFMATPYLMAYNALNKIDSNYEDVGKTCSISNFRILINVIIPCTVSTIREMFGYFFVNSMVTISAVAFLFNTDNMPLSLLINEYEGNMMLGEAAIVSLIILIINVIVKLLIYILNRKRKGEIYENYI